MKNMKSRAWNSARIKTTRRAEAGKRVVVERLGVTVVVPYWRSPLCQRTRMVALEVLVGGDYM